MIQYIGIWTVRWRYTRLPEKKRPNRKKVHFKFSSERAEKSFRNRWMNIDARMNFFAGGSLDGGGSGGGSSKGQNVCPSDRQLALRAKWVFSEYIYLWEWVSSVKMVRLCRILIIINDMEWTKTTLAADSSTEFRTVRARARNFQWTKFDFMMICCVQYSWQSFQNKNSIRV